MTLEGAAGAAGVTLSGGGEAGNAGNGQTDGGKGAPGSGQADGQQTGNADFLAGLAPENRELYSKKGWKSLDDVFKSYREAETFISKGAHKGKAPDGQGQQSAEVPPNPSGYQFKLPDGLPENFAYDKSFAGKFAEWAHNAQLPANVAQAIHDNYVKYAAEQYAGMASSEADSLNKAVSTTHRELVKEWGGDLETPQFKQNLEMSKRAMRLLDPGLKDALTELGVIRKMDGQEVVTNATVMKALAKVGSSMYAEDSLYGEKASEANPFDPKAPNLKRQGELIKSDPELAATLIRAAGQEKYWGHILNKKK